MSAWYVVATKPRQEVLAEQNLCRQGYSVMVPKVTLRKRKHGKWQQVVEPMFPGYLFVQLAFGRDDAAPIRSTIGSLGLVKFGQHHVPVPEAVIEPLINMGNEPLNADAGFSEGDRVRLEQGPLAGLTAVFKMTKGEDRAQVLITLLGSAREVMVPLDDLSKDA